MLRFVNGKDINDGLVEQQMKQIIDDINNTFTSEYEIAAQNVLDYIMQSRETDLMTSLRTLLLDLLITGYAFYKVEPTVGGSNVQISVKSPLNTFIDRNYNSPYVKDSYRAVVRTWMTKNQILNKYGKELSQADRKLLDEKWDSVYDTAMYYVRLQDASCVPMTAGINAGVEVAPGFPEQKDTLRELIPVYEVEWLETDKNLVMQRYTTVRIGDEIFIPRGIDHTATRTSSNPTHCTLSLNGIYFLNRGNEPYSMVLTCSHL